MLAGHIKNGKRAIVPYYCPVCGKRVRIRRETRAYCKHCNMDMPKDMCK